MQGDSDIARSFASDVIELNQLAFRYAAAVDACDVDAFLGVFAPDARLRTYQPDMAEPFADQVGHARLASVPDTMRGMYRATMHVMTNHLVQVDGDKASGTLLCTARHLNKDPTDRSVWAVMIRYEDRYERKGGAWRITDRQIRFLWSERHEVVDIRF